MESSIFIYLDSTTTWSRSPVYGKVKQFAMIEVYLSLITFVQTKPTLDNIKSNL